MQDIICINALYNSDVLDFWKEHGVVYPEKDHIDQIREVVKHSDGSVGVRLVGIENPTVDIKHPILGIVKMEPTFSLKRFRTLSGEIINTEKEKDKVRG